jgi:hypothetical protein
MFQSTELAPTDPMKLSGHEAPAEPDANAGTKMSALPVVAASEALLPACSPIRVASPVIEGLDERLGDARTTEGSTLGDAGMTDGSPLGTGVVSSKREPTTASMEAATTATSDAARKKTLGRSDHVLARAGRG